MVPDVRITTDIIVGFPGESQEDFEDTIDVMNQVKFDQIFNFKYSPRPNTAAEHMTDIIENEVASKRLTEVIELSKIQMDELMASKVGTVMEVLFEDLKPNGEIMGFTDNYCPVFVRGSDELLGQFAQVKIISASRTSLKGELL